MFTALLFFLLLYAFHRSTVGDAKSPGPGGYITMSLLSAGITGVTLAVLISVIGGLVTLQSVDTVSQRWLLRSLKGGDRYSGSFILGSGSIDSIDYYWCMIGQGENRWTKAKFKADGAIIEETDAVFSLVEQHTVDYYAPKWAAYSLLVARKYFKAPTYYYVFKVPRGTIVEEYKP